MLRERGLLQHAATAEGADAAEAKALARALRRWLADLRPGTHGELSRGGGAGGWGALEDLQQWLEMQLVLGPLSAFLLWFQSLVISFSTVWVGQL